MLVVSDLILLLGSVKTNTVKEEIKAGSVKIVMMDITSRMDFVIWTVGSRIQMENVNVVYSERL